LLAEHAPYLVLRQGRPVDAAKGTLAWVIREYKKSEQWKDCVASTQEVYNRPFDWLIEHYGTGEQHRSPPQERQPGFPCGANGSGGRTLRRLPER
jgi:hypothetical protein